MIWMTLLASEIIYFVVLVLLAAKANDSNEPVFTKIRNWSGFSFGGEPDFFTPWLLVFVVISLVVWAVIGIMSESWMRSSISLQNFIQRMSTGTSIAGVPGILGLIYGLMTDQLIYAGLLLGISFVLKFKFYPGLYSDTIQQFE